MKKVLVVVDMQNDFIDGSLGTAEAKAIVGKVAEKIKKRAAENYTVLVTMDTHGEDYLATSEGRNLPIAHCVKGTRGWRLCDGVASLTEGCRVYEKGAFGSAELIGDLVKIRPDVIEFVGLCTDICVVSNALGAKLYLPETRIEVDGSCCAGTTPKNHEAALSTMQSCQIKII